MRTPLAAVVVLLASTGCPTPTVTVRDLSSPDAGPCCPLGTGTLQGTLALEAGYVRSSPRHPPDGGRPHAWRSVQFSNAGACRGEGTTGTLQGLSLVVARSDGQDVSAGTFPVTDEGYTWPHDGGAGGPHGESCLVTLSRFSARDGGSVARAREGTVTFHDVTEDRVTGEFHVLFDDGDVAGSLSGTFDAPACAAGAAGVGPMP